MTKTTRKNLTVKAFQSELARQEKYSLFNRDSVRMERKLIGAANNRGENLTCKAIRDYCEYSLQVLGAGCSKIAYGSEHLAICFMKEDYSYCLGNQIHAQVKAWERIALSKEAKYFNPILSYGLHRGDKLSNMDERYIDCSFIVSPKAEFFGGIREAIIASYKLNNQPYNKDLIDVYYNKMMEAAEAYNIGDLHANNIGVIYDYSIKQYKAVITDYGLLK